MDTDPFIPSDPLRPIVALLSERVVYLLPTCADQIQGVLLGHRNSPIVLDPQLPAGEGLHRDNAEMTYRAGGSQPLTSSFAQPRKMAATPMKMSSRVGAITSAGITFDPFDIPGRKDVLLGCL